MRDLSSLHSRYNPRGEAEKYLKALNPGGAVRYFILIEPGLGYLIPPLREKYPQAVLIVLHAGALEGERLPGEEALPVWHPGMNISLSGFLEREIPDIEASSVKIIEWRPGMTLFGEAYLRILGETAEFIKRIDANKRTTAAFGRRWAANFFRNLALVRRWIIPSPLSRDLLITGAGPGLEEAFPLILKLKERRPLIILGAASSVPALRAAGIRPELVLSTDGGAWALVHLRECFRAGGRPSLGFAASLWAGLPSQCGELPVLALDDGSLWQGLILRGLGIPSLSLPQRGTVSASALDLAFRISAGKVFIAGMDLDLQDIRTHARPYGFDPLWYGRADRLHPVYSRQFSRAWETKAGGSHGIYASWFREQLDRYPARLFSLGNNHPLFKRLPAWEENRDREGKTGKESGGTWEPGEFVSGETGKSRQGAELLIKFLEDPALASALIGELSPLLFPGKSGIGAPEIKGEIQKLVFKGKKHGS